MKHCSVDTICIFKLHPASRNLIHQFQKCRLKTVSKPISVRHIAIMLRDEHLCFPISALGPDVHRMWLQCWEAATCHRQWMKPRNGCRTTRPTCTHRRAPLRSSSCPSWGFQAPPAWMVPAQQCRWVRLNPVVTIVYLCAALCSRICVISHYVYSPEQTFEPFLRCCSPPMHSGWIY